MFVVLRVSDETIDYWMKLKCLLPVQAETKKVPCLTMASNGKDRYVYQLPYVQHQELCRILDRDMKWEELGGKYMEFDMNTIIDLRRIDQRGSSPTNQLLTMWGLQNHTVVQLFVLLSKMHHYQAMSVLKPLVDPRYHPLLNEGEENISKLLDLEDNSSICDGEQNNNNNNMAGNATAPNSHSTDNNINIWGDNLNRRDSPRDLGRSKVVLPQEPSEVKILNRPDVPCTSKTDPGHRNVDVPRVTVDNPSSPAQTPPPIAHQGGPALRSENKESLPLRQERKMSGASDVSSVAESIPLVSYLELEFATRCWDKKTIIGKGGFGTVFKGDWKNTLVAIKRIEQKGAESTESHQAQMEQMLQELRILNSRRHDNILPLYGFSMDGVVPCLVYQFMPNGSLEDRLLCRLGTPPLNWIQRHNIARGTARGLQFLHMKPAFIHGDIKSANILLDKNYEPRIGDFGLARDGPQGHYTHMKISRIHGTVAYLPIDFLRNKQLSTKVDTYSYGIVLFELATGLRAYDDKRPQKLLKDFVAEWDENDVLQLHDRKAGPVDHLVFDYLMKLGKVCVCERARERPEMEVVLKHLEAQYRTLVDRVHYQTRPSPSPVPHVIVMGSESPQVCIRPPIALLSPTSHAAKSSPLHQAAAPLMPVVHSCIPQDSPAPVADVEDECSHSSMLTSEEVEGLMSTAPPVPPVPLSGGSPCSSPTNVVLPLLSALGTVDTDTEHLRGNSCQAGASAHSLKTFQDSSVTESEVTSSNNAELHSAPRSSHSNKNDNTAKGKHHCFSELLPPM